MTITKHGHDPHLFSLRGGRSLPDEAMFPNVAEDCFAPPGLAHRGSQLQQYFSKLPALGHFYLALTNIIRLTVLANIPL